MIRKFTSLLIALLLSVISTNAVFAASYPSPPSQTEDVAVSGGGNLTPVGAERADGNDTAKTNADGDTTQLTANKYGNLKVQVEPSAKAAYTACSTAFAPVNSGTELWDFFGHDSKIIKIQRIEFTHLTGSSPPARTFQLIRRSTATTGGTSANCTVVKLDTSSASAVGQPRQYTANPTPGTSAGTLSFFAVTARGATIYTEGGAGSDGGQPIVLWDSHRHGGPLVLRGTSEGVGINIGGISAGGTLIVRVEWTEE